MIRKIPIVATPFSFLDILSGGAARQHTADEFVRAMGERLGREEVFLTDSCTSALFATLKALRADGAPQEVVIPAYTASSLVQAVENAGLKPVLCDISRDDFGFDYCALSSVVSARTLCVVAVHLFGIVSDGLEAFRDRTQGVFVIEDCAQSFGSRIDGSHAGKQGDAAVFSFNRGKNLPTCGGGCIVTSDRRLAARVLQILGTVQAPTVLDGWRAVWRLTMLYAAQHSLIYGSLYPLIRELKGRWKMSEIRLKPYTALQAGLALKMLDREARLSACRFANATRVLRALEGVKGLSVPKIPENSAPAFNRLPFLVQDITRIPLLEKALRKQGIESSRMYGRPIHHAFSLGYAHDDFPNAVYCAEHLLTVPVHPMMAAGDLERMIKTIQGVFHSR